LESLPVFTRGLARLPNNARLIRELRLLERRTHRSGKDTVEHPRNGHDDHANVVCGVLSLLAPPAFEQPNELTSPIIVSGGPITHLWGGPTRSIAVSQTLMWFNRDLSQVTN